MDLYDGEQFLLYDSQDESRILIFATQACLNQLQNSAHWFIDGTFKTVPSLYTQLYTIHCLTSGQIVPCIYALLPDKREATYRRVIAGLLHARPNLQPQSVLVDYERAAVNALQNAFPQTNVKGCFFHLSQNIYRKVQSNGLQEQYGSDADVNLHIRMIAALAFVKEDEVEDAFETLQDNITPEVVPILDYFEDVYIGRVRRCRRRTPTFPKSMWNMYARVHEELPRTNNAVEGWHRGFATNLGAYHPNFWRYLDILKREQCLSKAKLTQLISGQGPPAPRRQYRDAGTRLLAVVSDYENRHILDFLRGIAYNIMV